MTRVKRGVKTGVKPRICGSIFTPDADVPPDQSGRQVCRCGLLGKPGDAHHTLPSAPPEQEEHRRRIGEQP